MEKPYWEKPLIRHGSGASIRIHSRSNRQFIESSQLSFKPTTNTGERTISNLEFQTRGSERNRVRTRVRRLGGRGNENGVSKLEVGVDMDPPQFLELRERLTNSLGLRGGADYF